MSSSDIEYFYLFFSRNHEDHRDYHDSDSFFLIYNIIPIYIVMRFISRIWWVSPRDGGQLIKWF